MVKKLLLRHGFTLIELLVVIAIIALLVAILMPSLNKAKMLANVAACAVNQRSTGLGLHVYASEYGDFPPAFEPVHNRAENEPYQYAQWTYRGDGHFWVKLLEDGSYAAPEVLRCTGLGNRRPYYWDNRHLGDDPVKGDAKYDYCGPLIGAQQKWSQNPDGSYTGEQELDLNRLDNPQTTWPSPFLVNNNLRRDHNVHVYSPGVRMLGVCPTVWWAYVGWNSFEPHGQSLRLADYTKGSPLYFDSYYRNGLFSDGHVVNRHRPETYLTVSGEGDRINPWMSGGYSANNPTTARPS